jgi:uncharacterized membrane protein YuzA (DUF378 family)
MEYSDTLPASPRSSVVVPTTIALLLLIVGGLNWALVGLFGIDLVATLFGTMSTGSRVVYALVGLGALYALFLLPRLSRLS